MSTPMSQARVRVPRPAWDVVEQARLTVVPRRAGKAPRVPFVSLVTLLLVGGLVGLLLFNTNMQQSSFLATSMEEQASVLAGKEESLKLELERLRDPQQVAARARQLGMVPAGSPAFVRLSDGKVLGSPTPAEADTAVQIAPPVPPKPDSVRARTVVAQPAEQAASAAPAAAGRDAARPDGRRASHGNGDRSRTKNQNNSNGAAGRTP